MNQRIKKIIVKGTKTRKFIMAGLSLFTAIVGTWAILKDWSTKKVAGKWRLTFYIEESSYKPYIGESHTQIVYFNQSENSISGNGEKWEYNGKSLPFDMHRRLEYTGNIDGSSLLATYVLHGLKRDSNGDIDVEISGDEQSMKGTFTGTAGDSRGTVVGKREN